MSTSKKVIFNNGLYIAGLAMSMTFTSCNMEEKPEDSKQVALEQNDVKFDDAKESDAKFLVNAAEINLAEIQLGQLAQTKGVKSDAKELGKMMETDHKKVLKELEALAAKKQITIPTTLTNEGQMEYDKLNEKTGNDFDKEYCDMMVAGHKDAIGKFEKASSDASDADIRSWANSTLPSLKKHLEHAQMCQEHCKKM